MAQQSIKEIKLALQEITDEQQIKVEWLNDERKGVQAAIKGWRKQREKERQLHQQLERMLQYEKQVANLGFHQVAGIDEVGRGPLAGPVVAACVIMPERGYILGVNDSKQLSLAKRETLYKHILATAISVGVGIVEPDVIDEVNIYQATKLAMIQAVEKMTIQPDYLLIDAMHLDLPISQQSIIKGDANSYSIACASIVAKVVRDRLMAKYAVQYPHYDFEHNAGYGTAKHLEGLKKYGVTPIHRQSFEPVKSLEQNKNM